MKRTILLLTVLLIGLQSQAIDIKAIKTDDSFSEVAKITQLDTIKINTPPVTKYTPKDLHKQTIVSFQGRNSETGAYTVWSQTFTDYNTKVTRSFFKDGKFYIEDNTGKTFLTGVDNSQDIQRIDNQVQDNRVQIKNNKQNINAIKNDVSRLNSRVNDIQSQVDKLDNKLEKGLATVTALTALHPNPRHNGRTQISVGAGMYADNVAGAIGIFHWLTDKIMLSAGASYGGDDSFAGNVGITIGF